MTGAAVTLRGATLRFGHHVIWDSLNLDITPGECLAILGPNGAGKTTLLKVMLGLLPLSAGTVTIDGRAPRRGSAHTGYVPQQRDFDRDLPIRGRDLVQFGVDGHRRGLPRTRARQVNGVIEAVGAQDYADAPVGLLSGGQQQRLRIAQALAGRRDCCSATSRCCPSTRPRSNRSPGCSASTTASTGSPSCSSPTRSPPWPGSSTGCCTSAGGRWAVGTPDAVMTTQRLSALYGTHIDVIRVHGRIVVVGGDDPAGHHHLPGGDPIHHAGHDHGEQER